MHVRGKYGCINITFPSKTEKKKERKWRESQFLPENGQCGGWFIQKKTPKAHREEWPEVDKRRKLWGSRNWWGVLGKPRNQIMILSEAFFAFLTICGNKVSAACWGDFFISRFYLTNIYTNKYIKVGVRNIIYLNYILIMIWFNG